MSLSTETRARIESLRAQYPQPRSAVLPALWAVQDEIGHLSTEGMVEVAGLLGLTPSEVQAVSTFYSMYFDKPTGRHHAIVCINVSCALRGADEIVTHLEERLGCRSGETTADGEITWEQTVECLGACGGAPAMQLDHHFHENLTPEGVDRILDSLRGTAPAHAAPAGASREAAPAPSAGTTAEGPPPEAPPKKRRTARSKRPQVSDTDL